MKFKDIEEEALATLSAQDKEKAVEKLRKKAAELKEAKKIVKRLQFEYDELLEEDV